MSAHYERGIYVCKITEHGLSKSKEKGTPCVFLTFKPVSEIEMTEEGEREFQVEQQYERTVRLWITDKTVDRTAERLCELGWAGSDWTDLAPGGVCNLVGTEVRLECQHELYNNDTRERWDFPFGGTQEVHDPSVAKSLNAMFGRGTKKPAKAAARPAAPAANPVGVGSGKDIPF